MKQVELDEQTYQLAQQMATQQHITVSELFTFLLGSHALPKRTRSLLGLMADEPELMDTVTELAMTAREQDSLRIINEKSPSIMLR